jgi:hypothetical protein
MIFQLKQNLFYYKDNFGIINDYYQMIVEIIKNFLYNNSDLNINITLCNNHYNFNNNNKTIKININYEHTLVKKGGRDVLSNTPFGNIYYDNNEKYLVRIDRYNELNNSNIIIDYSIPNIYNVKSCQLFNLFSNKHIYISSSIYDFKFIKENRSIITLTTFINTNEPRRAKLLNELSNKKMPHINVNNCFEKNALKNLYENTKILINIHQTPHHDTFEELRVLPALQCGVIVIGERSPLNNLIPYNEFIIWTDYNNIINTLNDVISNYDYFYDLIFSKEKIGKLFNFNSINYNTLSDIIKQNIENK